MARSLPVFAGYPPALRGLVAHGPFRAIAYPDARWDDGDTLPFLVDMGFRRLSFESGRLLGVNAPERRDPGGPEARSHLIETLLPPGRHCLLHTLPDREKYGRWLVVPVIAAPAEGRLIVVNEAMVRAGYAAYDRESGGGGAFRALSAIVARYAGASSGKDTP